MKLQTSALRNFLLFAASLLLFNVFPGAASAQQTTTSKKGEPTRSRFPAAKAQPAVEDDADADAAAKTSKTPKPEKDSADVIRKRDEWFYKQRASANGHIPAGARTKALAHMQRMMEAEGKLIHRADGSIAEVLPAASPVTNTWTSIGPTPTTGGIFSPVTGRITTIAVDPSDATGNTVLVGGAQGGIWRSTDAGATWAAVGDQNSSLAMGSIAFAPSAPLTVYAGTGEQASVGFDVYYGAGVLKSADGGKTWAPTCTTPGPSCPFIGPFSDATPFGFFTLGGARISYVAVNPSNPQMVMASAQFGLEGAIEGVYCTDNGGTTWSQVLSGEMSSFVGFASSSVAFAALGNPFGSSTGAINGNGIYKATGIGATCSTVAFSRLLAGAPLPAQASMGRIDIGISPLFATDNTVYASIANGPQASSPNLGVFVSTNGGTTWTQTAAPDICNAQCWYDNVVKVDPNGGAHAFFAGGAVLDSTGAPIWVERTANTGVAWSTVIPNAVGTGLPHVDNHALAFAKLSTGKIRLYLGNDGGIWRTDDAEATPVVWTNLNDSTLTLTQFYPALSIHPSSPLEAFAGAQDNGSQIYSGSLNWTDNGVCGDGTGTAIDNVVPSTVYVTCNGNNIAVSTLNGQLNSFVSATNGINPADNINFVPPLVTDPSTANVVYTGTTKVYQSVNAGLNWTAISNDLVSGANFDSLIALAVAPSNPHVIYAGADTGQVFVATNVTAGNGTFAPVAGQASLPPRQVSSIAVDGADPLGKTAYAAFSGFSFHSSTITDLTGHLFKTADGGATWTDVSCTVADCSGTLGANDLPNSPVNDVVIDPDIAGTLYAATDIGVFIGTCTTTAPFSCSWATLSTGLPRVATLSLKLHHASRTLRAATHGRGVWDVVLNNFTFTNPHITSISPVSVLAGSGSASVTVNGVGLTGGTVLVNGVATNVTTTPVSDTQLTATIGTALTGAGAALQISASTGAGTSNALTFTVLGGAPTITSVAATQAPLASLPVTITVTGTNFSANSQVLMNPDVGGTAIPTTFVSSTSLTATIPASFTGGFGSTNSVGVENPPPGGGTTVSNPQAIPPIVLPTFTVVVATPANDSFANATIITPGAGGVFTDTVDSSGATSQTSDPLPGCAQSVPGAGLSNTIWYKFVPTSSGTINDVDTIGSSYDSVLSIWTGSAGSLTVVACNDDIVGGIDVQSQLINIPVTFGTTYFIMVSSFGPADPNPIAFGGKSVLNFTFTGSSNGGTFTIGGAAATATAGASANSTITVTSSTFAGTVAVTCGNALPGVTCGALSIPVTAGATATGQLAINVLAPSSATTATNLSGSQNLSASAKPASTNTRAGWWTLSGGTGFAAIFLLLLPGRKRYRAALGLGLICLLSFTIGCGGYGGGGGGGPASTTTHMTVSGTKVPASGSITVSATVTSTGMAPAGTVQFFVDGAALGTAVPLASGGSTGNITLTAAQAPALLQLVGTHSVSAHYLGDAYTTASQSGSLNVTITGTANLPITGTAGASNANGTVSLTIQ